MAYLTMLVIFHVNIITCQIFNLPHIYYKFVEIFYFLGMKILKLVTWYQTWFKLYEMTWFNILSTFIKNKNH
jgi:hypothetical protein